MKLIFQFILFFCILACVPISINILIKTFAPGSYPVYHRDIKPECLVTK